MKTTERRRSIVWMNVTTSANWHRPVVGVVRVEQELSRNLAELYGSDQFGQCVFQNGEFVPYNALSAQTAHTEAAPLVWPDTSRRFPRSSSFDQTLGVVRRVPNLPPRDVTRTAPPSPALLKLPSGRQIQYGDIIVSVGLDWDYGYVDKFQALQDRMGIKIVTFCHDLMPILFPQHCVESVTEKFQDYFMRISWASSLILCNSQRSRSDYLDFAGRVGAPAVESVVIPLGDNVPDHGEGESGEDENGRAQLSLAVSRAVEEPFILFVSTIERRKNHEVLYRAYHLLARAGHGARLPKLVFVGMAGWGVGDLLKDIELDPLTRDLIVQLNHVTDHELSHLYQKAYFCAYPSLYEGWGLPVGEALAYGKAVIASGQGSIPEVGGDLVFYLDPWNAQAWADTILALVDQPERVAQMEAAVRNGYRTRTWRDTARAAKAAIDRLREPYKLNITLYPGYDLSTVAGLPCGETLRSTGAAGVLTHGPYRVLPSGTYEIDILIDKLEGSRGQADFHLRSAMGTRQHETLTVNFDEQEHFGLVVTIHCQIDSPIEDFEIITYISEGCEVMIQKIDIRELS